MNAMNIVLITIDCARADIVLHSENRSKLPNIADLAFHGISFKNAYAHGSYTRAAFVSIFSGTYKSQYNSFGTYIKNQPNFVERLRDDGFFTAGVNSNRFLSKDFGYGRGFEVYRDLSDANPRAYSMPVRMVNNALSRVGGGIAVPAYPSADRVTDSTLAILENVEQPYFLWVHYMDAHWPYNLDAIKIFGPWNKEFKVFNATLYRKALKEPSAINNQIRNAWYSRHVDGLIKIDHQIGRLMKQIDENCAVVITSDHGEAFGEHGTYFHHSSVYDENLHVPLIVKIPGLVKNHTEEGIVRHIDLAPTLLELVNLDPDPRFLGVSLLPTVKGDSKLPDLIAFSEVNRHTKNDLFLSMRKAGWSAISTFDAQQQRITESSIYDLKLDPFESKDLSKREHIRLATMQSEMLRFLNTVGSSAASEDTSENVSDKSLQNRLRALGYIE